MLVKRAEYNHTTTVTACYHLVQTILCYSSLAKNVKINIYRNIKLAYGFVWVWNLATHIEGRK
jgi:hypothetical protein